jgi:hypothetical protein
MLDGRGESYMMQMMVLLMSVAMVLGPGVVAALVDLDSVAE